MPTRLSSTYEEARPLIRVPFWLSFSAFVLTFLGAVGLIASLAYKADQASIPLEFDVVRIQQPADSGGRSLILWVTNKDGSISPYYRTWESVTIKMDAGNKPLHASRDRGFALTLHVHSLDDIVPIGRKTADATRQLPASRSRSASSAPLQPETTRARGL